MACVVEGEDERRTDIALNIKEEKEETVTLEDYYDKESEEESEEDAATNNSEPDAIEKLSKLNKKEDEAPAFEDSEPKARVVDAGLGESKSNQQRLRAPVAVYHSSTSSLVPSLLSLMLALAVCVRH